MLSIKVNVDFTVHNTVLLDIWWNMLIEFSKQITNTFAEIIHGYKSEFKLLLNIWDGASCKNSQKIKVVH